MMESTAPKTLSKEDETLLRDSLKRCSPDTIDAALEYRATQNPALIPTIITGIIDRFLDPDMRPRLREGGESLRFMDDLGIDSLTMMEIVMLVESTLDITIDNNELQNLRTVGDVNLFIEAKITGKPAPEAATNISIGEIIESLPHAHPFLFLQDASLKGNEALGSYKIAGDEFFLDGHFKNNPVFPASIMLESLGQLAVLFLIKGSHEELPTEIDPQRVFFTGCENVRCQRICRPGETLTLSVKLKRLRHPIAQFDGSITCGNEKVAMVENLALSFDFVGSKNTDPLAAQ